MASRNSTLRDIREQEQFQKLQELQLRRRELALRSEDLDKVEAARRENLAAEAAFEPGYSSAPAPAAPRGREPFAPAETENGPAMKSFNPETGITSYYQNTPGGLRSWISKSSVPPPVDPDKKSSYAELLIDEVPKRLENATRLARGGDIAGGENELRRIRQFTEDNRDVLTRLSRYSGTDFITKTGSDRAKLLLSGGYMTEEMQTLLDPKRNPESVRFDSMALGLDSDARDLLAEARNGGEGFKKAFATAVFGDFAGGNVVSHPAARAQERHISATGNLADVADINAWSRYASGGLSNMASELPAGLDKAITPGELASGLRKLFDSGDGDAGGKLLGLASAAAKSAAANGGDSLAAKNAFMSTAGMLSEAVRSYSAGDPLRRPAAVKSVEAIVGALPPGQNNLVDRRAAINQALGKTALYRLSAESGGVQVTDEKTAAFAVAQFKSASNMTLGQEEARMMSAETSYNRMISGLKVDVGPLEPASVESAVQGAAAPAAGRGAAQGSADDPAASGTPVGYQFMKENFTRAAGAVRDNMIFGGKDFADAVDAAAPALGRTLAARGAGGLPAGTDQKDIEAAATTAAKLALNIWANQSSLDLRNINAELDKHITVVQQARREGEQLVNTNPKAAAATMDEVKARLTGPDRTVADDISNLPAPSVIGDISPGPRELNEAIDKLANGGIGQWTDALTQPESSKALATLFGSTVAEISNGSAAKKAKEAFLAQAKAPGMSNTSAKLGDEALGSLADTYVKNQLSEIKYRVGSTDAGSKLTVRDAVPRTALASWDITPSRTATLGKIAAAPFTGGKAPTEKFSEMMESVWEGVLSLKDLGVEVDPRDFKRSAAALFINKASPLTTSTPADLSRVLAEEAGIALLPTLIPARTIAGAAQVFGAQRAYTTKSPHSLSTRLKGFLMADFELPSSGEPARKGEAADPAARTTGPESGVFSGEASRAMQSAPQAKDKILGWDMDGNVLNAVSILRNNAAVAETPVYNEMVRDFLVPDAQGRSGLRKVYGTGANALQGRYYAELENAVVNAYSPGMSVRDLKKVAADEAKIQFGKQTKELLDQVLDKERARQQLKAAENGGVFAQPAEGREGTEGRRE